MRQLFIDKNVLLEHVRKAAFDEGSPLDTEVLLRQVHAKRLVACISSVTPFMLVNYLIYKFRRKYGSAEKQMEKDETRSVGYVVKALVGNWDLIDLTFDEMEDAFTNRKTHFEDSYQYACAQKASPDCLVTWNVKDFSFSKEMVVMSPRECVRKLLKDRIIKQEDIDSVRDAFRT